MTLHWIEKTLVSESSYLSFRAVIQQSPALCYYWKRHNLPHLDENSTFHLEWRYFPIKDLDEIALLHVQNSVKRSYVVSITIRVILDQYYSYAITRRRISLISIPGLRRWYHRITYTNIKNQTSSHKVKHPLVSLLTYRIKKDRLISSMWKNSLPLFWRNWKDFK